MARIAASVRVLYDGFPDLQRRVRREADRVVQRSADRVAAAAKANTPPRVDTGAMMNGWRVDEGTQGERLVTNTQEYALFNELGTAHLAPHPMLIPAVAAERGRFVGEMSGVLD